MGSSILKMKDSPDFSLKSFNGICMEEELELRAHEADPGDLPVHSQLILG